MPVRPGLAPDEDAGQAARPRAAERVFAAARELFYQRGIRAVGVDEIVARAGVTKPSLYRSYASKDALVAACLRQCAAEGQAAMEARIAAHHGDPPAQLRAIVAYFHDQIVATGFRGCPMSNAAVEFPEPDHPGRRVLTAAKHAARARLRTIAGGTAARDPDALADALLLVIEGGFAAHHVFGCDGPAGMMTAAADALIAAFVRA